jgi:hypothetical protein
VVEQVIERVFNGAGEKLLRKVDRKKSKADIDRLAAGHRALSMQSQSADLAART